MHHSTFDPVKYKAHDIVARQLASDLIDYKSSLYSQHIPGEQNVIADSLSRDFYLSDSLLIQMLRFTFKKQVPKHFAIYPIQKEIICWIESLKAQMTDLKGLPMKQEPSKLEHLANGKKFIQMCH